MTEGFVPGSLLRIHLTDTNQPVLHIQEGAMQFDREADGIGTKDIQDSWTVLNGKQKTGSFIGNGLIFGSNTTLLANLFLNDTQFKFLWVNPEPGNPSITGEAIITTFNNIATNNQEAAFDFGFKFLGLITFQPISFDEPFTMGCLTGVVTQSLENNPPLTLDNGNGEYLIQIENDDALLALELTGTNLCTDELGDMFVTVLCEQGFFPGDNNFTITENITGQEVDPVTYGIFMDEEIISPTEIKFTFTSLQAFGSAGWTIYIRP